LADREPEDEDMTMAEILADIEWQTGGGEFEYEPEWDGEDSHAYAVQQEAGGEAAEFPEGFQGAGPMYAAIPLGEPWLIAASRGATTYVMENPNPTGLTAGQANAEYEAYTGWSAFLDRAQAEQLADHPARDGVFVRYEGLTGYNDLSAKAAAEFSAYDAGMSADSLEAGA
jgi:hypothetical protein